jgi:hypothetical protein
MYRNAKIFCAFQASLTENFLKILHFFREVDNSKGDRLGGKGND